MESLRKLDGTIPNVLKRGAKYFTISTDRFLFNDTLNFSSPCNLSSFLKQWKVEEKKSIFPYTRYGGVEELVADTNFPPRSAFYSDLTKQDVDLEAYNEAARYFNACKLLPENDPRKMRHMGDWLKFYNLLDVGPLCQAMERSFECFYTFFGLDATQYLSLPRIALEAVVKMYAQKCSYIFTFGEKWNAYRKAHRDNVNGGCVAVYHR